MPAPDRLVARLLRLVRDCRGASATEYGIILAMIAMAMVAAANRFTNASGAMYRYAGNNMDIAK
ncbi:MULTISPECIES: Flp family type IVb pilin [Sphingomonas]|jgi:Flp pilus assembly pilin Flp|uniref:Flp family type IVb pilin n=1 Tax=Sphingomonas TaxID=13687 RepID=UPI000AC43A54|nr:MULTISPECIES: Flp family type IVb pilin [Sphingomonas]